MKQLRKSMSSWLAFLKKAACCSLLCFFLPAISCVEPLENIQDPDARTLTLSFYIPGGRQTDTKTLIDASVEENMLHDIQVWAFDHDASDDDKAVAFCNVSGINNGHGWYNVENRPTGTYPSLDPDGNPLIGWSSEYTFAVTLFIPGNLMRRDGDVKLDFYVLGNAASIGRGPLSGLTRTQVDQLTFGVEGDNDWFGGTAPVLDVPARGLPISSFYDNEGQGVDISFLRTNPYPTTDVITEWLPVVQLSRAVSRVQFVFSRPQDLESVQITKIEFFQGESLSSTDSGLIPELTYVFPGNGFVDAVSYDTAVLQGDWVDETQTVRRPLLDTDDIGSMEDPAILSGQGYDALFQAIEQQKATQLLWYSRESNRSLRGKIWYKLDGVEDSEPFYMSSGDSFLRNNSWTVFAYFTRSGIQLTANGDNWESGGAAITLPEQP